VLYNRDITVFVCLTCSAASSVVCHFKRCATLFDYFSFVLREQMFWEFDHNLL